MWWIAGGAAAVLLLAAVGLRLTRSRSRRGPLEGYDSDFATLERQYHKFYGKLMQDPDAERLFGEAGREVAAKRYEAAIELLRTASREAALPVVFNDLGVLLTEISDRPQAALAFREALARDAGYGLVTRNLVRLGGFNLDMARPVTEEEEPNNSMVNANLITLGTNVRAEITEGIGDIDVYRFIAPPAPRDRVAIEIQNRSLTLELGMRIYDGETGLALDRQPEGPGQTVVEYFTPSPNSTWYVELRGAHDTSGEYTIRVSQMNAFDRYEPNDDIFDASPIDFGTTIEANILDPDDTDFYRFESPVTGTVTIDVTPRGPGQGGRRPPGDGPAPTIGQDGQAVLPESTSLIPALTIFGPDKRTIGFGPDIRTPGASLHQTVTVEAHRTYYLQVWPQERTSGEYSLTVQ